MEPLTTGAKSSCPSADVAARSSAIRDGSSTQTLFVPIAVVIFAVALILRVFHLDYLSLWNDEIFSRYYYDLFGPRFLLTTGMTIEPTPPLYYFVLQGWMSLFGHGAIALRSLSVLASLIALPLVYAIAREVSTRNVALVAAALFAVSPMSIFFAQEARVYMMTAIPASLMLLGIARGLRTGRTADLVLYGVGAVIGMYSHATLTFMVASCNIVVIAYLLLTPSREGRLALRNWILSNVVVAVLAVPLAFSMLSNISHNAGGLNWIPPISMRDVIVHLTALVSGMITPPRFPGVELTVLLLLVLGIAIVMSKMPRRTLAVLVAIPLVYFALVVMVSLKQTILLPRVLCWLTVPLCAALAYAVTAPSRARLAARVMLVLTFGAGLYYQLAVADGAKSAYRQVFAQARPGLLLADEVVITPYTSPFPLMYYAPGVDHFRKWRDPQVGGIEPVQIPERLGIPAIDVRQVSADIKSGKAVWLVADSPDARFLSQLLAIAPPPERDYESMCHDLAQGVDQSPSCLVVYGWNVDRHAVK